MLIIAIVIWVMSFVVGYCAGFMLNVKPSDSKLEKYSVGGFASKRIATPVDSTVTVPEPPAKAEKLTKCSICGQSVPNVLKHKWTAHREEMLKRIAKKTEKSA